MKSIKYTFSGAGTASHYSD